MSKMETLSQVLSREVDSSAFVRYIHSPGALRKWLVLKALRRHEARTATRHALCLFLSPSDRRRVNDPDLFCRSSHPFAVEGWTNG
jgi:hypothetical protein